MKYKSIFFAIVFFLMLFQVKAQKIWINFDKNDDLSKFFDDFQDDIGKYQGEYLDASESGDCISSYILKVKNKNITGKIETTCLEVEGKSTENLENIKIVGNVISATGLNGKFVLYNYKEKNKTTTLKGFIKIEQYDGKKSYKFCQKIK